MPLESLGDFLKLLEAERELLRVRAEVDHRHQIAALTAEARRSRSDGGPALLFESVRGSRFPVVTNLLGNAKRVALVLGGNDLSIVSRKIEEWLTPGHGESRPETPAPTSLLSRLTKLAARPVKNAFAQQVVRLGRDVNLEEFSFPRNFEGETGRTITGAQVMLPSPDGRRCWVSSPVLEIAGPQTLLVHWTLSDQGPDLVAEHRALSKQTPVMISLGSDPLLQIAAQCPSLPDIDPYELVGVLRGQPLNLTRGRTVELDGPADAECLIEGYLDLQEVPAQGTVADASGLLVPRQQVAIVRVTAMTHRAQMVLPVVVHSAGGNETDTWNPIIAAMLQPALQRINPAISSFEFSQGPAGRRIGIARVETRYPGHARQALQSLATWPPLNDLVSAVAIDNSVDLVDNGCVWAEVALHVDPAIDLWTIPAVHDASHRACRDLTRTATLLIDATHKPDPRTGEWIALANESSDARQAASELWQELNRGA